MRLLADKTGEQFLNILEQNEDEVLVQFITNEGITKGKPFKDSLRGLSIAGWRSRETATSIGRARFEQGFNQCPIVSFALHQLFPLGRKVKLPSGEVGRIASYANTHEDGYYMYLSFDKDNTLTRLKMTPEWKLLPSEELLALPYYPAPKTQEELDNLKEFQDWAKGY